MKSSFVAVAALLCSCGLTVAEIAWPQFRGVNSQGHAEGEKPPIHFGPESNLVWKAKIPTGLSSPCIWKDHIFLTGVESNKLITFAIDRRTGKILWQQTAPAEKIEYSHPKGSPASSTPATDGKNVYAYFGSYGLLAYDFQGREQWRKPLDVGLVINGSGTSPALMNDRLIVACDQQDWKSFVMAIEPRTGKTIWQTPRSDVLSGYTTPILWKHDGHEDIVVSGSIRVAGYALKDGKEQWSARGLESISVAPSPVLGANQLYVMSRAFGGAKLPAFADMLAQGNKDGDNKMSREEAPSFLRDHGGFMATDANKDGYITEDEWNAMLAFVSKGEHGIFALRAPNPGDLTANRSADKSSTSSVDVTSSHIAWKQKRGAAPVASPLFYKDRLYTIQDGGRVTCLDAKTGQPLYEQERLGADGEYYASPLVANDHIYFASTRGFVTVIRPGDTLEVTARNGLEESVQATPAIAANHLYVRSASHLWSFGER